MKKDNTTYITEQRDRLKDYIDRHNEENDLRVSGNAVSRSLGISGSQLSQFMNKKYTGDNLGLAKKINAFLKRQKERVDYNDILQEILSTKNVQRVMNIARICHIEGEIGVVTGEAGISKTSGLKKYISENPGSGIFIEVVPGMSAKILMTEISKAVGLAGEGTQYTMFGEVKDKLKNSGRLIIVDEAEHLPVSALELLRRIHDLAGVGILICGLPKLLTNLRGKKNDFKQLYSRVGVKAELKDLEQDDVKMLVQSAIPSSNGLYKHFYRRTQNGRTLSKLIKRSIQVAQVNSVDIDDIDETVIEKAKQYVMI
ncbi:MAG: AAA family ATPase [Balneolales bacterium]